MACSLSAPSEPWNLVRGKGRTGTLNQLWLSSVCFSLGQNLVLPLKCVFLLWTKTWSETNACLDDVLAGAALDNQPIGLPHSACQNKVDNYLVISTRLSRAGGSGLYSHSL